MSKPATTNHPAPRLYGRYDVARRLGVHPKTVWAWERRGLFPANAKLGPRNAWTEELLAAYEAGRAEPEVLV